MMLQSKRWYLIPDLPARTMTVEIGGNKLEREIDYFCCESGKYRPKLNSNEFFIEAADGKTIILNKPTKP